MRKRTKSREAALKILYAADVSREDPAEAGEKWWAGSGAAEGEIRDFTELLIEGVYDNLGEIDGTITKYADNWKLERMAVVDRNILRLACFELLYVEGVPPKVAINEAIELAKKYGDKDSSKFVNGILDKINKSEDKENGKAS